MSLRFIADPTLPGHGEITGVFWSPDRTILGVSSVFRLLTQPPARAAYGGQLLRQRVALYRPPEVRPFALFDDAAFPIRTIAFHPSRPIALLGGGAYDGGYMFEGQALLWNWSESRVRDLGQIPQVLHCELSADGNSARFLVRPWDRGFAEEKGGEEFRSFFVLELEKLFDRESFETDIRRQLETGRPLAIDDLAALFPGERLDPRREIASAFGVPCRSRSPIWDIARLDADTIAVAHDDCQIELFGTEGERKLCLAGESSGVQIFHGPDGVFVHLADPSNVGRSTLYSLARLDRSRLVEVLPLGGRYTFSMRRDGVMLGRADRPYESEGAALDLIVSDGGRTVEAKDLGHYDVFNHFLRVDRAPELFFVRGEPPQSHERKRLCALTSDGEARPLWPLLEESRDGPSHAMMCCFAYVGEGAGAGLIVAGLIYVPGPKLALDGFIYRKSLDGAENWRHATRSAATSIQTLDSKFVIAAFLDGSLAVLRAENGDLVRWEPFAPDGLPTVVISIAIAETEALFGTLDGRICVMPLAELTGEDARSAWRPAASRGFNA